MSVFGEPTVGQSYRINFTDIDGNALSTAGGHITSVVLISNANVDKAHSAPQSGFLPWRSDLPNDHGRRF